MSVVHQAIENGVGKGRIADDLVPMFDWKLAGHHGRSAAVPILHDLQEVAPLLGGYGSKSPIVEDEKLDASQALEEPSVMAVAACKRERIEEPRQALIEDGAVIPTGLVAERAGNPTLADAGRTSVIMPGARRLKLRSFILSIHGTARWSSRLDASAMLASSILLFGSGTAPSPYYQPGWLSHGCLPSRC